MPSNEYGFGSDKFDWDVYAQGRPKYPDSLWKIILDYHRSKGGEFEVSHDIGAGFGIVAETLHSPNFKHVNVSDPVEHNLDVARKRLAPGSLDEKFTFRRAGSQDRWLSNASVDLVTAAECLHWADSADYIDNVAAQIKPGGTFAAVYYNPRPLILGNDRLSALWYKIFSKCADHCNKLSPIAHAVWARVRDGLDTHLPITNVLFEPQPKRIEINANLAREDKAAPAIDAKYALSMGAGYTDQSAVKVLAHPDDAHESITDLSSWVDSWDINTFKSCVFSLQPTIPADRVEEDFDQFEKILREEAGGRVQIVWIVQVVLATRKT